MYMYIIDTCIVHVHVIVNLCDVVASSVSEGESLDFCRNIIICFLRHKLVRHVLIATIHKKKTNKWSRYVQSHKIDNYHFLMQSIQYITFITTH